MDDKMKILLDKINIDENSYQYFNDAQITKIKVNSKNDSWCIFINKKDLLPIEIYEELDTKKYGLDKNASSIEFVFNIENPDINIYLSYYDYLLRLLKEEIIVIDLYKDSLVLEENKLLLIATNAVEKKKLSKVLEKINKFYKKVGYDKDIELIEKHDNKVLEEVQEEIKQAEMTEPQTLKVEEKIESTEKKQFNRAAKDPNSVIGRAIKEDPIKIKTIIGEDPNVVVEAKVFGVD